MTGVRPSKLGRHGMPADESPGQTFVRVGGGPPHFDLLEDFRETGTGFSSDC
jgi:hypothetical protein